LTSSVNFAQPDVTLRLDLSGVIRRAALSSAISSEPTSDWVGRPWADTVTAGGNAQVRQMLEDARTSGVSSFHQVRQRFPSGLELSVEYTTVRLGGDAGLLAIGRNLEAVAELRSRLVAAQMSMERDYWKLRDVETRYRLLFDASAQPVLLIGSGDMRILEANPAAIRALGVASDCDLLPEILATERDTFRAMLHRVREQGKAPGIVVHLGSDRHPWLMRASLIASEPSAVFVLQLSPSGPSPSLVEGGDHVPLEELIARLPDGVVVIDAQGTIVSANGAFLELVEHSGQGSVLGQPLGRWLSSAGSDADVLMASVRRLRSVNQFTATVRGERGAQTNVLVSAAGSTDSNPRFVGVLFRRVGHREANPLAADSPPADRLGKLTLREIVQETVSALERKYILAVLDQAKGNRTAAAQILGLSRQGLYMKLERYSLDDANPKSK
jgi:transcriptional regulator PpsR